MGEGEEVWKGKDEGGRLKGEGGRNCEILGITNADYLILSSEWSWCIWKSRLA